MNSLTATVSGSFRRHLDAISQVVQELMECGVRVLSPADPRIVDSRGEFLFVASDEVRSVRLVQDRHLESIRSSSFLWLVSPDGYVGQSASLELGFAAAVGTPVFGTHLPTDLTLRQYVHEVPNLDEAITIARRAAAAPPADVGLLIDPIQSIARAYDALGAIDRELRRAPSEITEGAGHRILDASRRARRNLEVPVDPTVG